MPLRLSQHPAIEAIVMAPVHALAPGLTVRRALPSRHRRMVGPFIFLDQMGPATFAPGAGLDVPPHPHIGLATLTYLFAGEVVHRDSLGTVRTICPGEVNWMTAGSGIVHSERSGGDARRRGGDLYGLQAWVALPKELEQAAPSFAHHSAQDIPSRNHDGVQVTLVAGTLGEMVSPVQVPWPLVYAHLAMGLNSSFEVPSTPQERALYVLAGTLTLDGDDGAYMAGELVLLRPRARATARAARGAQVMLLGGEPLPEPRHVSWNFVASDVAALGAAAQAWRAGAFARVPGDDTFVPMPDGPAGIYYP